MDDRSLLRAVEGGLEKAIKLRQELSVSQASNVADAASVLIACLKGGGKVLTLGNGGSAADAQHFAAELVGRFRLDRDPLPAIALTTDSSIVTSIANDFGYDQVFVRQVQALARPDDVVVAASTSGRSPNVVAAIRAANESGATTIALTGGNGGELAPLATIAIVVPSSDTARIQEMHIIIIHILCELIEDALFRGADQREAYSIAASPKVVSWPALLALRRVWKRQGKKVVWTNGCFDLLHAGHLHSLEGAKALGNLLVVGVNSDDSVKQLKGRGRPFFSLEDRLKMLAALQVTDCVVPLEATTPEFALAELKPDIHVKGMDYAPPAGKPLPEKPVVDSYGGRVEFVPLLPGYSTTEIVERILHQDEVQREN